MMRERRRGGRTGARYGCCSRSDDLSLTHYTIHDSAASSIYAHFTFHTHLAAATTKVFLRFTLLYSTRIERTHPSMRQFGDQNSPFSARDYFMQIYLQRTHLFHNTHSISFSAFHQRLGQRRHRGQRAHGIMRDEFNAQPRI